MAQNLLRIGTRESQLAVWQATLVQNQLKQMGVSSELVYIKSEGDIDTVTPLYELGVQGIFTKTLDAALLGKRIDIAVHSMKDVPTVMARGIRQAAVLPRASHKDLFVYKAEINLEELGYRAGVWAQTREPSEVKREPNDPDFTAHVSRFTSFTVASSSIRRKAQWLNRFPHHRFDNLRGNVNTRLRKLDESNWQGAIFAAAGLERIHLRPQHAVDLDWMLPAPAQGAILVVCRTEDETRFSQCRPLNDEATEICTRVEREFLNALMGGCSTPISALAEIKKGRIYFNGNMMSVDGTQKAAVQQSAPLAEAPGLGLRMANQIRGHGGQQILDAIRQKGVIS